VPFVPQHAEDFPSLGWALLDWYAEVLPSPRDPSEPLILVDDQALALVEFYRLNPETGERVYRRGYSRRSKGKGKSPWAAAWAIGEFAGPVRFDGWDADGQPVGRRWGTQGDPRPWVQVGAVSEDQTDNTWSVIYYFLTENDGRAADVLGIDPGLTRCFLRGVPGAKLEPTTSASGSREGQPITASLLDESHLMTASNGGVRLAATMRRNAAKMGGTSFETTNSFVIGAGSVAESSYNAVRKGAAGIFADELEAPREIGGVAVDERAPDEVLEAALKVAYGDSYWIDTGRLVRDMRDPSNRWEDSCRFFLNWNQRDGEGWSVISKADWSARAGVPAKDLAGGFASLAVGRDQASAALGFAARRPDGSLQVEVGRRGVGTSWVVESCKTAQAETGQPIVVLPRSSTAGVLEQLRAAGVQLREITPAEHVEACAAFQNDVIHGGLVHLSDVGLTDAVRLAEVRNSGESWVFSSRASSIDICDLDAVVLAAFAARSGVLVHSGDAVGSLADYLDDDD
jgi:hypothetical protein